MRKLFFIVLLTLASIILENPAKAQAYAPGQLQINAGFSAGLVGYGEYFGHGMWGWVGWGEYRRTGFVPLFAIVEYGIHKWISIGSYIGYLNRGYRHRTVDRHHRWNFVNLGVRSSFHWAPLMNEWGLNIDDDRWDFYSSLLIGMEIVRYKNYRIGGGLFQRGTYTRLVPGIVLGTRYMFT
ncbi:MAG: hypothetical protein ACK4ND_04520, partial [Cytophagaceae bacterium]